MKSKTRRKRITNIPKYHFKHHILINHPAIILDEYGNEYLFARITHNPKKDKTHKNTPLKVNPNPKDKRVSFLQKPTKLDNKKKFKDSLSDWHLDSIDEETVREFIKGYKKK